MKRIMRVRTEVLIAFIVTLLSFVSCGTETHMIRISDGVWSGTVIPAAADADRLIDVPTYTAAATGTPDTGYVTDEVTVSADSAPVVPETSADAAVPETIAETVDTLTDDTPPDTTENDPTPVTAAPETTRAPETTKAPETTRAPETDPAPVTTSPPTQSERKTGTVYWVESGKVWHITDKCSSLSRSKEIMSGTVDAAKAAGKERVCKRCGG